MHRDKIKQILIWIVNILQTKSTFLGSPQKILPVIDWCMKNKNLNGVNYIEIEKENIVIEKAPIAINNNYPSLFSDEFLRVQKNTFVATIPNGRVWGKYGAVITSDDTFLYDVSREFGKYGGVFGKKHSINKQVKLVKLKKLKGRVAVIATAGSANYHHWLYDTLPRIHLLKIAGFFDSIDQFVIDYTGLNFQKESLLLLGVPLNRIILCNNHWNFHIEAEELVVPSLPARLGTMSDWVINFLRKTFIGEKHILPQQTLKIYLSRRKALTRKLNNEEEIFKNLASLGYVEFFAEDHSIRETAKVFSQCESIIGVHGSGFGNLAFISPNTKILDILAPKHFDCYYWMITNNRASHYAYLFGKGEHLPDGTDLVQNKIDDNIDVDMNDLNTLLIKLKLEDAKN